MAKTPAEPVAPEPEKPAEPVAPKPAEPPAAQPVVTPNPVLDPDNNTPSVASSSAPLDAILPQPQPEAQTAVQVEEGFTNRPSSPVVMTPGAGPANEPPMQLGATVVHNEDTLELNIPQTARVEATSEPHMLRVTEAQYNDTVRVAKESGAKVEDGIIEQDGRRIGKLIVDGEDRSYEVYG